MRAITKQTSTHAALANEHNKPADAAKLEWRKLPDKSTLLAELLTEQFHLCCYSEIRADRLGYGYHIEHIKPKSQYPQCTFDYENLAASAFASDPDLKTLKQQGKEYFGGHFKDNEYDANRFISCHQDDCARFFAYLSDGRVTPALTLNLQDQAKAQYTITTLNLNNPWLVTMRQKWWADLEADENHKIASKQSRPEVAATAWLLPSNNQLSEFFSLTRQFFGPVAEQVLQEFAPSLK